MRITALVRNSYEPTHIPGLSPYELLDDGRSDDAAMVNVLIVLCHGECLRNKWLDAPRPSNRGK